MAKTDRRYRCWRIHRLITLIPLRGFGLMDRHFARILWRYGKISIETDYVGNM